MKHNYSSLVLRISVTVLFISFATILFSQNKPFFKNASIYLVRHAEKDTGNNPGLNDIGRNRSGYLVSALKGNSIRKIFVTQYRRTQQTADSLCFKTRVDTIHYLADVSGNGFLSALEKHRVKNNKILVIGHSNTLPILIGRLGITKPVSMADDEYNTLYLVKFVKGEPRLFRKKFGNPKDKNANTNWEEVL